MSGANFIGAAMPTIITLGDSTRKGLTAKPRVLMRRHLHRRAILTGGAASFVASAARAADDTLVLSACGGYPTLTSGNQDPTRYTPVDPAISDYSRTIFIVGWGQSNCAAFVGEDGGPYVANPNVHMMDVHTGGVYRAQDPMLGCNGNNQCYLMRLADNLIYAGKADRVVITNLALGSTSIAHWANDGHCAHRFNVAALRFKQLGWAPTKLFFQGTIGEDDNEMHTSREVYAARGREVVAICRKAFSMVPTAPFMITKTSWILGHTSTSVQKAQEDMVSTADRVYMSANTDAYTSRQYRAGPPEPWGHLSVAGAAAVAADCLAPTISALAL